MMFLVAAAVGVYANRARFIKPPAPRVDDTSCATYDKVNMVHVLYNVLCNVSMYINRGRFIKPAPE